MIEPYTLTALQFALAAEELDACQPSLDWLCENFKCEDSAVDIYIQNNNPAWLWWIVNRLDLGDRSSDTSFGRWAAADHDDDTDEDRLNWLAELMNEWPYEKIEAAIIHAIETDFEGLIPLPDDEDYWMEDNYGDEWEDFDDDYYDESEYWDDDEEEYDDFYEDDYGY